MKFPPARAKLFHEDRRTDMTKLIVAFRNFANAPNNLQSSLKDRRESLKTAFQIKPYKNVKNFRMQKSQ